jgi:hypothetical protein
MSSDTVDYLSEDTLVNNYKFCCISIVSPQSTQKCKQMGVMIRGGYETQGEALERIHELKESGNQYNIWVGQIGYWLPVCFNKEVTPAKQLELLNMEMKNKITQKMNQDNEYNQRREDLKQKIKEEQDEIKKQVAEVEAASQIEDVTDVETSTQVENATETTSEIVDVVETSTQVENASETSTQVENVTETSTQVENVTETSTQVENASETTSEIEAVAETSTQVSSQIEDVSDQVEKIEITEPIDSSKILESFDKNISQNKLKNDPLIDGQSWVCLSFITPPNTEADNTTWGLKVRGIFDSLDEANELAENLQKTDSYNHIFVASMCKWLSWDPSPDEIKNTKYENSTLNTIFDNKDENKKNLDIFNEVQKKEQLERSLQESMDESSQNQKEIIDKIFD